MSGGHPHGLFHHGHGRPYRLPPQCKIVATVVFVLAVVITPREAMPAFAAYALLVAVAARSGEIPIGFVVRRLVIEVPFVAFAILLPFIGGGPDFGFAGLELSREGTWAAWNIVAKATLSLSATVVLAATTTTAELLHGLEHLRMPRLVTAIAGFMIRYLDVISGEVQRMRIAREARGYSPRFWWQARALAATAGTLFIRSYERGERVYRSMLSRGFTGAMPIASHHAATSADWVVSLTLPAAASAIAVAGILL